MSLYTRTLSRTFEDDPPLDSRKAFKDHLQTYDQMHDQPSKMFMEHLGKDHIESTMNRVSGFPSVAGDWIAMGQGHEGICQRCSRDGIWVNDECVCGCLPCVQKNDWTWGDVIIVVSDDESIIVPVPCNGSRSVGPDAVPTEYTNLETIVETLSDMWDHIPDWSSDDPDTVPRWSQFFDAAPTRTHMIVCKELNLWHVPETARHLAMEPGQPWVLQQMIPDPNVLEDDDDELIATIVNGLEPRQLFQDDDEEGEEGEERKELCSEAQKLLDGTTGEGGVFNEESYRLLSNLLMKIHQL